MELIENAISQKKILKFNYDRHLRIVEPDVFGILDNLYELLGYQIGGSSSSGGIPNWRRFKISKISNISITGQIFPGKRSFPSGKHSSFDKRISIVD